jgi:RNA polymerase sigma-70 factor (ECF subfamily)
MQSGTGYRGMTDEALMAAIQEQDKAAFAELYDRYADRLLRFLQRMLGNDHEKAQDFLQEVFMRVIRSADNFKAGKSVRPWIYAISMNLCKNEYRRLTVRQNTEDGVDIDSVPQKANDTESQIDMALFQRALEAEIHKLPAYLRSTFLLRFQCGMTIREISEIMACSQGTVKSRLFYMTQNLAEILKSYNPYNVGEN